MDFLTLFNYEFKSLAKSARATVFSLVFVSAFWGVFFSHSIFLEEQDGLSVVWLLFFALLASAGFANISFVKERLSGAWEILLASGISRKTVFLSKLAFCQSASFLWGLLTLLIAYVFAVSRHGFLPIDLHGSAFALSVFFLATFAINSTTAYLTVININPRAVQLANFMIMATMSLAVFRFDDGTFWGYLKIFGVLLSPAVFVAFLVPKALYHDNTVQNIVY